MSKEIDIFLHTNGIKRLGEKPGRWWWGRRLIVIVVNGIASLKDI